MTFIFILIITVIITWFLVDKKEHQSNLKKVGGLRVKYKELLNFLVSKSNDDVKLIDKGVELYVSYPPYGPRL